MPTVKWDIKGMDAAMRNFEDLSEAIGDKKATSKVLIPAMREAMKPVLMAAKEFAPKNTGALAEHLWIEARRPNKRDKKSLYVRPNDKTIAIVTTKAFPKKLKKKFNAEHKDLTPEQRSKAFKKFALSKNFPYDARAVAQEFGSARNPAHPYMRTALESNTSTVIEHLKRALGQRIDNYKMKNLGS